MTVGICIHPARVGELHASMSLTMALEQSGHDVSLAPYGQFPGDRMDHSEKANQVAAIKEWSRNFSHVVFTSFSWRSVVAAVNEGGVETAIVASWSEIQPDDRKTFKAAGTILCPSASVYKLLRNSDWDLKTKCVQIDWDFCLPLTNRTRVVDPSRVAVAWHLDVGNESNQDIEGIVRHIRDLMSPSHVFLTILMPYILYPAWRDVLKQVHADFNGRVALVKANTIEKQLLLLADHDLVISSSVSDDFGLLPLLSFSAGTPCVAYDIPVVSDVFNTGGEVDTSKRGALVPCRLARNWLGVPFVADCDENRGRLMSAATRLAGDYRVLNKIRKTCQTGMAQRGQIFRDKISSLFSD